MLRKMLWMAKDPGPFFSGLEGEGIFCDHRGHFARVCRKGDHGRFWPELRR
jgi:hypothetical protein